MKAILPVLFIIFFSGNILSQNGLPQNAGARGAAMGNASVTFTDINSIFTNQAGLAYLEDISVTVYGERRFLVADGLNSFLFGFAFPHQKIGTFGLNVHYFGFGNYNEQKIGLSYARKLFKRISLGAQFNYIGTRFGDGIYGSSHNFTFELGMLVKVSKQFHLGAHVFSPARIELVNGDAIPSLFKIGAAYIPSDKLILTAEVEKDLQNPFNGKFGIEYNPIKVLHVRAGFSTAPLTASFGLGLNIKGLSIDVFSSYHMILGFSPGISISYSFKRNGNVKTDS